MYSNSNSQRPTEPVVKSCKLLFRASYHYTPPTKSNDSQSCPFTVLPGTEKGPSSSQPDIESSTSLGQDSNVSSKEVNETNMLNGWEQPLPRHRSVVSRDKGSGAALCSDSYPICVRSQSMNSEANFTGQSLPSKSFISSSGPRLSLQGTKPVELKVPKDNSIQLPKILRPIPQYINTHKKQDDEILPQLFKEPDDQKGSSWVMQAKAADIARIYRVNQFPKSVSKNLFLDNYHTIITRKRFERKMVRVKPGKKLAAGSIGNDLHVQCPHCCCNAERDSSEWGYERKKRRDGDEDFRLRDCGMMDA